MMGNFGVGIVAIIVVIIFVIAQLWYIILPLTALGMGIYFYYKHDEEKTKRRKEKEDRERRIRRDNWQQEENKRIEEERIKKEKHRIEEKERKILEEEKRKEQGKKLLVEKRLEQFHLDKNEAELIFGKIWKKRFEKPDELFIKEVGRISDKLFNESYKQKISPVMEKVFDIIDICMHEIWGKMNGWDDIDYENWEEDWQDVRDIWKKEKHRYHGYEKQEYENTRENNYAKYYAILGLKVNSSIREIKTQYRKLMLKFHPDKNKSVDAEKKCREIMDAYTKLMGMIQN